MNYDRIDAEQEAARTYVDLIEMVKKCQAAYERAHMELPTSLRGFFGMNGTKEKATTPAGIPPPQRPEPPLDAEPDWVCIDSAKAGATNIALAILRAADEPVRARDLVRDVTAILPSVRGGTIANIGNRLEGDIIRRTKDGWELIKQERAGILRDGLFWGPPSIFTKQELAAHRRDAILHILKFYESGLQTSQLLEQLRNCSSWVRAPINKELVQDDVEILRKEEKVKRRGASKKWELAMPKKEQEERGGTAMSPAKMGT
ncbi:MAG TPA: hypothetical protein VJH03_00675 [Blastocatellia bacterium]|nr:hypothetical protein [Blastocatellia bacterium]